MKIGGEYRFSAISEPELLKAAKTLRVDTEWAMGILDRLRRGMVGAFEAARDELTGFDKETSAFAGQVIDAVTGLRLASWA